MPCTQALILNRIFTIGGDFDKGCNNLERFLLDVVYNSKPLRKEILRAKLFQGSNFKVLNKEQKIKD